MRDFIGKLRGNMRAAVLRLQRKATSGSSSGAPPRAHKHHSAPAAQPSAPLAPQPRPGASPYSAAPGFFGQQSSSAQAVQQTSAAQAQTGRQQGSVPISQLQGPVHGAAAGLSSAVPCQLALPLSVGSAIQAALASPAVQAPRADALPPPVSGASGPAQSMLLDLSGLQAILQNARLQKAAQGPSSNPSTSAAPAAPATGQMLQHSQSTTSHSAGHTSSAPFPAPAPASTAAATPAAPTTAAAASGASASVSGFGSGYPGAAAAALAAVDAACAQDAASLDVLLDAQRSIRHDCGGEQEHCFAVRLCVRTCGAFAWGIVRSCSRLEVRACYFSMYDAIECVVGVQEIIEVFWPLCW